MVGPIDSQPAAHDDTHQDAAILAALTRLDGLTGIAALEGAANLARSGEYLAAEGLIQRTFAHNHSAASLDLLARIYAQQSRLADAEECWRQVVKLDPACRNAHEGMAEITRNNRRGFPRFQWLPTTIVIALCILLPFYLIGQVEQVRGISVHLSEQTTALQKNHPIEATIVAPPGLTKADLARLETNIQTGQDQITRQVLENQLALSTIVTKQAPIPTVEAASVNDPLAGIQPDVEGVQVVRKGDNLEIRFDQGLFLYETVFSGQGTAALRNLAFQMVPFIDQVQIKVIGFGDDQELDDHSIELDRALAVVKYFSQTAQLPEESFAVIGTGSRTAPYPNNSWENRLRNRSVILILLPKNP